MKRRCVFVALIGATLSIAAGVALSAEEKQAGGEPMQQPSPDQMQQMMAKWLATINPGEHHEKLAPFVGAWNLEIKTWMGGPGTPPSVAKGKATARRVLGKRYVLEEMTAQMMLPDATGQLKPTPFEGLGMTGYDNYRNMYQTSWADNMSTDLLQFSGACDPDGKTFRYYGAMDEPMLDVIGRTVKVVYRVLDEDKHVFEMYDLHAGDDYKVMEITYTRQK
jgi:hypothetical protein